MTAPKTYQPCADECCYRLGQALRAGRISRDSWSRGLGADFATEQRLERMVERVHALGPRVLAELLAEIATATDQPALIADRVAAYARLDPDLIRAIGADKFPPMLMEVVW